MFRVFVSYVESSLTCKFDLNTAILEFNRFEVSKNPIFHNSSRETLNGAFCVSYAESRLSCKFNLNTAILELHRFEVSKNPIFDNSSRRPQMARFLLFELNTAILDSFRFEVSESPSFHNSSRRPQMSRFVLVTLRAGYPANLSSIRRFQSWTDLRSAKI